MLDERRRLAIDALLDASDDAGIGLEHIARFDTDELDYFLDRYNWDDGFEIPTAIANSPHCCHALALRLFWSADGEAWFTTPPAERAQLRAWDAFCKMISTRLIDGRYAIGHLSFDPQLDRVQLYKIKKAGVMPEALYAPIAGSSAG